MTHNDCRNEASRVPLSGSCEHLEAYQTAPVSSHLRLQSDLFSRLAKFLIWVPSFVTETVGVLHIRVLKLILLALNPLDPEPGGIVKMLHSAESSGTLSGTKPNPLSPWPDPSS